MAITIVCAVVPVSPAAAHQPVLLDSGDTSPRKGPLLPDGTVSYAVRAGVAKGQDRGFRVALKQGDRLAVQLLILDRPPANALASSALPEVTLIDPDGKRTVLPISERTTFYEPYSKQTYLYLSRLERLAKAGTYGVLVRGRSATPIDATIAVGYREVPGRVIE